MKRAILAAVVIVSLAGLSAWLNVTAHIEDPALTGDRDVFDHVPGTVRLPGGRIDVPAPAQVERITDLDGAILLNEWVGKSVDEFTARFGAADVYQQLGDARYLAFWSLCRIADPDFPGRHPVAHCILRVTPSGDMIAHLSIYGSGGHHYVSRGSPVSTPK
ncbi:MAG: hypothetical protein PF961_02785 [Planctomycetota bacterium]|jgi:hypothetical protein|nr:hypothetical protein [Planctomycetota bacterium]